MTEADDAFGFGTFSADGGVRFPGLVVDDTVFDLRAHLGPQATIRELLASEPSLVDRLAGLRPASLRGGRPLAELHAHPPVEGSQIFCAGANYARHVRQIMVTAYEGDPSDQRSDDERRAAAEEVLRERARSGMPYVFVAPPQALCGARDDVILWGPGHQHDWELELAVVIGRRAADVPASEALAYVAGYTICNDVSTRDVMARPGFPMTDFLRSKCRPTFFPTGPYIVPARFVADYRALRVTLSVNGEAMQDEEVSDIIYGVEELIAYTSSVVELAPGDLLLTGSPAGNAGHHGNRWLRPGDVMEGTITGLGTQRNRCIADPRATG